MALVSSPGTTAVDAQDQSGRLVGVSGGWRNFFNSIFNVCNALTMSGTTGMRPTVGLWVGRMYFDTTLGTPIWLRSIGPVVWVNAAGAPV